jgi:hypothetical protein
LQWSLRCGARPLFLLPVHDPEGGGGVEATGVEASGVEATGVEATGVEASGVEASGVEASSVEASPESSLSVGISLLTLIIRGAKNELIIEEPEQANTPTVSNFGSAIYINKYFSKS